MKKLEKLLNRYAARASWFFGFGFPSLTGFRRVPPVGFLVFLVGRFDGCCLHDFAPF